MWLSGSKTQFPKAAHFSSSNCTILTLSVCVCVFVCTASWLNLISIVQCKDQGEVFTTAPSPHVLFLQLSENIIIWIKFSI